MHHLSRCSADFPAAPLDDFRLQHFRHRHSAALLESQAARLAWMVEPPVSPQALMVG